MSIQDEIPRSRINLRYRTEISGAGQMLELPFRLMIMGDLSCGSSVDREIGFDGRRLRSLTDKNPDSLMENMRMSLNFKVPNRIDPSTDESMELSIPIKNRRSFSPDQVAHSIPKVRALLMLRKLLLEMQANIDNRKELRRLIQDIWSNPDSIQALEKELQSLGSYKLTTDGKTLPAAESPAQ